MDSCHKLYGQQPKAIWTAVTSYMDSSHKLHGQQSQLNLGNIHYLTSLMNKQTQVRTHSSKNLQISHKGGVNIANADAHHQKST